MANRVWRGQYVNCGVDEMVCKHLSERTRTENSGMYVGN